MSEPLRVLVCGDRDWSDYETIEKRLARFPKDTVIIHGACRGADTLAGHAATKLGLKVEPYPADWTRYGYAAGPIRNAKMLEEGKPELGLAFHANLARSKGTKNMVGLLVKATVPHEVIRGPKEVEIA